MWAGVDSAWEQKKLEARKMLENAADSHTSTARFVGPPTDYFLALARIASIGYTRPSAPTYDWSAALTSSMSMVRVGSSA